MRGVWLGILLASASCAHAQNACRLGFVTELPLQIVAGQLLTTVVVNGAPLDMIVDTGAQTTVITKSQADRLGLKVEDYGEFSGIGGYRKAFAFYSRSFQIGQLSAPRVPLFVSDMTLQVGNRQAGGLLGADFLAAYDVDLNLREHKATLYRGPRNCPHPAVTLAGPLYYAKFAIPAVDNHASFVSPPPDDPRPLVSVHINRVSLLAMIDTGADSTVIYRSAAHRLGLDTVPAGVSPHRIIRGVGPNDEAAVQQIVTPLQIGELTISRVKVDIVDKPFADKWVDMLLGMDVLSHVHPWLSFSSHTLVVEIPPKN